MDALKNQSNPPRTAIAESTDFWSTPEEELLKQLDSGRSGLSSQVAAERLAQYGPNRLKAAAAGGGFRLLLRQISSPLTIILLAAAITSFFLGEATDAIIILSIVTIGAALGCYQEKGAAKAMGKLLRLVQVRTNVMRDGAVQSIPLEETVPGDLIVLDAGQTVPGDCRLLEAKDLFLNEASLTGETFPAEKKCGLCPSAAALAERNNLVYMGTHVISGTAKAIVVTTGAATEFGAISGRLRHLQPETEFERGIRHFGYLLMEVTVFLVICIFSINLLLHKPILDSLLFSLAIAVGLTPQLLPAIISINLSRGASHMARRKVIVKKLSAIENFGSMDVLCTDKTGTITQGEIHVHKALNAEGDEDKQVLELAWLNANFETGYKNPIDKAILQQGNFTVGERTKIDELPYDFIRKRLSIVVKDKAETFMITKGAFDQVLEVSTTVLTHSGQTESIEPWRQRLLDQYKAHSAEGYRVIAVARKELPPDKAAVSRDSEQELTFCGVLLLSDPPKPGIAETLQRMSDLGVSVRIITGDNPLVAREIARQVGLGEAEVLTGPELQKMSTEALIRQVDTTRIFAAVEPNQKERIILALKKAGHVVGFMGDGINDAPAIHSADVGISVEGATDVAREAADIVLLGNDLGVLSEGILEGRRTFANTLKYIFMATSANFGNMFSMAGASLFLPFLPLLPKQILLTNLLTDIPEMTIASDTVDEAMIKTPHRMDVRFVKRFMVLFGLISSIFDYCTFFLLIRGLKATPTLFRTGWFLESVISASLIVLIVRTAGPFYKSRPGKLLLWSTAGIIAVTLLLPWTPLAGPLGFAPLPARFFLPVAGIIIMYIISAEMAKRIFYAKK